MQDRPLILVVDDDVPILTLMKSLLKEFGFETVTAGSGESAIATAREHVPDLILLDRNMPGMSGAEVISALRTQPPLRDVPVLILSGEPIDHEELAAMGAVDGVQKPFDVPTLIGRIRSHLNVTR